MGSLLLFGSNIQIFEPTKIQVLMAAKKVDELEERLEGEMSQMKATVEDRISFVEDKVSSVEAKIFDLHEMVKKILKNQIQMVTSETKGPMGRMTNSEFVGGTIMWKSWRREVEGMEKGMVIWGMNQGVLVGKEKWGSMAGGALILKKRGEEANRGLAIIGSNSQASLQSPIYRSQRRASEFQNKDGAYLQMMMSYSPAAKHFLCIAKWADCSLGVALGLAGAFGLLRVLICESRVDGRGAKSKCVKKASIKEFYSVIFPSLIQMQKGITVMEDYNRMTLCIERGRKIADAERRQFSELDIERDEECGICMELNGKIVIPNCCHAMCFKCYSNWY
ncbi:hypothetical protein M5K25_026272 [Dendrobium thyrsiflorum]|uniref:Uncharacterized protein n=1 Tax=Dendrobium thyrsiflorum TaxID=117978 RepID=A0ABD0TWV1_DENTH